MKLIVGLGNPSTKYQNTKHNVGFMFADFLAREKKCSIFKGKFNGEYTTYSHNNEQVIIFKPLLYMNLSGLPLIEIVNYYHIKPQDILVIYDDMDIPFNHLRLRMKGNAGGHNGMKSIIEHLHSNEFCRIRVGIDRPIEDNTIDYVLSKFGKKEIQALENSFQQMVDAVDLFVENKFVLAMNKYNTGINNEDNK